MTHAIPFDTLHHYEKMIEAGFTEKQAKAQTDAIAQLVEEKLATKRDISELKREIRIFGGIILAGITILGFLIPNH
jgi:hypothetical protein